MYNQLVGSSEKERRKNKKIEESRVSIEHSRKKRQTLGSTDSQDHSHQLESQMPVSLVTPIKRQYKPRTSDVSVWDIETSIKSRLKQKQIFLPQIDVSPSYSYSLPRNSSTQKHKVKKQPKVYPRNSILKTCGNDPQLSDQYYDETLIEIDDLNDRLDRYNRRKKHDRRMYRDSYNIYEDSAAIRRKKFNHISRQQQFEQYVDYLENMYNRKRVGKKLEDNNREYIEEKLMSRVDTRQRNNSRNKDKSVLVQESKNEDNSEEVQDQTKKLQQKVRKEAHDTFIKILRKAKNRGESLLVKLSKFPSRKLNK